MTSQPATMVRPADVGSKVARMRTVVGLSTPLRILCCLNCGNS
jgi:hypothetical protein